MRNGVLSYPPENDPVLRLVLNGPPHHMNTSEPLLPQHLYSDSPEAHGTGSRLTFSPEKLIAWSEDGHGDAIDKWCKHICEKKIVEINTWEDNQILYLEDEWASTENDIEEEDEDEEEIRFHQACEVVTREAEMKREIARVQMDEHKAAIEKLVRQASASNATLTPPLQESQRLRYLIAVAVGIGIGIAVTYVLLAWQ
jgi:hypothetical protein